MAHRLTPVITFLSIALFWLAVSLQKPTAGEIRDSATNVAIAAPIQVLLYGGDRFFAANIESIRAMASVTSTYSQEYRLKAHLIVSQMNPCHEDNYWVGNASLSWGGAEEQGFELLRNAMHCRFWDEWPAFFYGFNQNFFRHDIHAARDALELAAQRSKENAAVFRNLAIMLSASQLDDTRAAMKMLSAERDTTKDPKLRQMLDKRVERLRGLVILRDAQAAYEKRYKRPLQSPEELLSSGLLEKFPEDPLQLGYEFNDHTFQLHQLKIQ